MSAFHIAVGKKLAAIVICRIITPNIKQTKKYSKSVLENKLAYFLKKLLTKTIACVKITVLRNNVM